MKRSYIKRRSRLKKKSAKGELITKINSYLRAELIKERGNQCELSGRPGNRLGLFHILPVGQYPRLRFHPANLLLVNWFPCHYLWHHDPHMKESIENKIKELRGENYLDELKVLNAIAPKIDMFYLKNKLISYES